MKTQIKIFGPPGTGKTTKMLSFMEQELDRGVLPAEIGFVSFTKKAANEARDRALKKFPKAEFPWCRTLHSLAFRCLNLTTKQTMKKGDYKSLGNLLGIEVSGTTLFDDQIIWGNAKGDRLFFMVDLARNKNVPLRALWEAWPNEDIQWGELDRVARALVEYKQNHLLMDYVDMIQEFVTRRAAPNLKAIFVDEAQDLKNLEWQMVKVLTENVERSYIAGDDDQAIYRWAGADVEHFIDLEGEQQVLGQSYRVPALVAQVSQDIIRRVRVRHPKTWLPRAVEGTVTWHTPEEQVDLKDGSWLVLARNRHLLEHYQEICKRQGYSFDSILGSPIRPTALEAIRYWEVLRKGEALPATSVLKIYDMMSVRKGFSYGSKVKVERLGENDKLKLNDLTNNFGLLTSSIWHDALDRISIEEREYVLAARRNGEALNEKPRIKLSTIHGAKGGEADNVLLMTDMAPRTYRESMDNPCDEARVWYVATTRAKEHLHLMQPSSNMFYQI